MFSGLESSRKERACSGHLDNSMESVVEDCPDIYKEIFQGRKKSKKSKRSIIGENENEEDFHHSGQQRSSYNMIHVLLPEIIDLT
jgi:hypothetical protein